MNESDTYREWLPPQAWLGVVACCWEQRVRADRVQRVLPDGHADVLLYGSGEVEVVGVYDHVALPVLPAGLRAVRRDEALPELPEGSILVMKATRARQPVSDCLVDFLAKSSSVKNELTSAE